MSIPLFAGLGIFTPLQSLWRRFTTDGFSSAGVGGTPASRSRDFPIAMVAAESAIRARLRPATRSRSRTNPPLRVLRVMEAGQANAHVGRMRISGRMADVCAELDRMVERESALNLGM